VSGQLHALAALTPGKELPAPGGLVGPRSDLDDVDYISCNMRKLLKNFTVAFLENSANENFKMHLTPELAGQVTVMMKITHE
jgi:hypothetical protein